jgi:hypothetical protein
VGTRWRRRRPTVDTASTRPREIIHFDRSNLSGDDPTSFEAVLERLLAGPKESGVEASELIVLDAATIAGTAEHGDKEVTLEATEAG